MIFIALLAAIITVLCSPIISGVCPAQGNSNPMQTVVNYQLTNTDEITDPMLRTAIQKYLDNVSIGLRHYYSAISCEQITKLKLYYEFGYRSIQGASEAVWV